MVSGLKEPARISHLNWAGDVELYQLNGTGFIMIVKSGRGVLENWKENNEEQLFLICDPAVARTPSQNTSLLPTIYCTEITNFIRRL